MKLSYFILFFLLVQFQSYAQKLSRDVKDSLRIVLDEMGRQDQKHRWEIMYGTNIQSKIDFINKLPIKEIGRICCEHKRNNKPQIDSLSKIQNRIDKENRNKLVEIINKYGFPSPKRVKSSTTEYILLHFASSKEFKLLNPIFLKEIKNGNMPGRIYASWFDRILYDKGEEQLYGEYNKRALNVENIENTNHERKKIGLKKLKKNDLGKIQVIPKC